MSSKKPLSLEEKLEIISEMDMPELQMRRELINFAIRTCQEANDPHGQIPNYKGQLQRIDDAIRKLKGRSTNPPVETHANVGTFRVKKSTY